MKDLFENLKKRLADEETIRYAKFLAIPFIALILIIVIVTADKPGKEDKKEQPVVSQESVDAEKETKDEKTESKTEEKSYHLEEASEELCNLMEDYFKARKTCDVNGLAEAFGDSVSAEQLSAEGRKMEEEVKYYQDYENITCLSGPGLSEDSFVVYTRFDIKFRQADTLAPSMSASYVKRGADGNWRMMAGLTPEETAYMESFNGSETVQAIAEEVNSSLRAALEADSNLLAVYDTLMNGGGTEEDITNAGEETGEDGFYADDAAEQTQASASEGESASGTDAE